MNERHGYGIFDCPMPDCHEAIVGSYSDLVNHVRGHPLSKVLVDGETGKSVLEQVKEARSDALERDIREQMVVASKQNHSIETGTDQGENNA
jgi:hypothetical protein